MTTPVVESRAESAQTSGTTTHTITKPTGMASGDLWLMYIGVGPACSFNTLTGYTEILDTTGTGGEKIIYRVCDGSEGATVAFTSSATSKSATISWRISGHDAGTPPSVSTVATGTSANPNPDTVTPGGTKDFLYIAALNMPDIEADDDTWCSAAPSNGYGNLSQKTTGTSGTAAQNATVATAEKGTTATSSDDPAAFTVAHAGISWRAYTIAVHPTSGAATFERAASVDASADVVVAAFQRDHLRQATVDAIADIVVVPQRDLLRQVSLDGIADIVVVPQRDLLRQVSLDGIADIVSDGEIEGVADEYERAASIDAVADIVAQGHGILSRSASVDAVADIASAGSTAIERSASVDAVADIAVAAFQRELQRSASLDAIADIVVVGQIEGEIEASASLDATAVIDVQGAHYNPFPEWDLPPPNGSEEWLMYPV